MSGRCAPEYVEKTYVIKDGSVESYKDAFVLLIDGIQSCTVWFVPFRGDKGEGRIQVRSKWKDFSEAYKNVPVDETVNERSLRNQIIATAVLFDAFGWETANKLHRSFARYIANRTEEDLQMTTSELFAGLVEIQSENSRFHDEQRYSSRTRRN